MEFFKRFFLSFFVLFHIFSSISYAYPVDVRIYTPNLNGILDAQLDSAGYSDVILWGYSDYHPHDSHELLSGEWAAAIYYDGNPKAPNAMWLTD